MINRKTHNNAVRRSLENQYQGLVNRIRVIPGGTYRVSYAGKSPVMATRAAGNFKTNETSLAVSPRSLNPIIVKQDKR